METERKVTVVVDKDGTKRFRFEGYSLLKQIYYMEQVGAIKLVHIEDIDFSRKD